MRFTLGVDEAGRGPLAGPVSVGVVAVPEGFDVLKEFLGVRDSKKLSPQKREKIFAMLEKRAELGEVRYAVEFESAGAIDREGIAVVIRRAVSRGVNKLVSKCASQTYTEERRLCKSDFHIMLDGSLTNLHLTP